MLHWAQQPCGRRNNRSSDKPGAAAWGDDNDCIPTDWEPSFFYASVSCHGVTLTFYVLDEARLFSFQ